MKYIIQYLLKEGIGGMLREKKTLILILAAVGFLSFIVFLFVSGSIKLPTLEKNRSEEKNDSVVAMSANDLKNGFYYIWHNPKGNSIQADLEGTADLSVFRVCPSGIINWEESSFTGRHVVWFSSREDDDIPTLYPKSKLLYISPYKVPFEGIEFERFADYGYTIGVANMVGDKSGHYRIIQNSDIGYTGFLNPQSDAVALEQFTTVSELFLDKLGDVEIRDNLMSAAGTVMGLKKDTKYVCEWYTGTYYQDFEMTANIHTFSHIESFTTYEYEFLHSNCISITIPEWFKSGYYYVGEIGMFRYVAEPDIYSYTGKAYDPDINWNDPIILYDDDGNLIYNPATGYDKRDEYTSGHYNSLPNYSIDEADAGMETYEGKPDEKEKSWKK